MYFTDLNFKCPEDKCKSVFVDARGKTRACSSQDFSYFDNLAGKTYSEKVKILRNIIETKDRMRSGEIAYPLYHIPDYREGRGGLK